MTKHGRLIDADALDNYLFDAEMKATKQRKYVFSSALNTIRGNLAKFPTIEPERKTGKWYKPTGMMPPEYIGVYRCDQCDEIATRDWKSHRQILSNFCPNCGADMRGEQDENNRRLY